MDSEIEKEYISILMESPLYFVLGVNERYDLLLRLMKIRLNKSREMSSSKIPDNSL
jgi:hypothetical protein